MRRLLLLVAATLACAAPAAADASRRWRILGPGGGGSLFHPTISPHDSRIALVACDMTGAYLTRDGGATWRMFNLGEPVRSFVFDPLDVNVIYALTQGVFRSGDGGDTWKRFFPRAAQVGLGDDHASGDLIVAGHADRPGHRARHRPRRFAFALPGAGHRLSYTASTAVSPGRSPRTCRVPRATSGSIPIRRRATARFMSPGRTRGISAARESGAPPAFRSHHGRSPARRRSSMPPSPARSMSLPMAAPHGAIPPSPDFRAKPRPSPPHQDHPEIAYVSYSGLRAPVASDLGRRQNHRRRPALGAGLRHRARRLADRPFRRRLGRQPVRPRCGAA